jgi:hypothetical protein
MREFGPLKKFEYSYEPNGASAGSIARESKSKERIVVKTSGEGLQKSMTLEFFKRVAVQVDRG